MGLWQQHRAGRDTTGLIQHSDKGVQYVAVRYTQRGRVGRLDTQLLRL